MSSVVRRSRRAANSSSSRTSFTQRGENGVAASCWSFGSSSPSQAIVREFQPVDAVDAVVFAPAVGGAVRAAANEAVQHGQERRALQRELMVARPRQALNHAPAACLLPHPLEGERRTDAPRRHDRRLAAVERIEHDRLVGKPRARAQKRSSCPLSCRSSTRPSVAITCWRTAAPSRGLSTICR